MYILLTVNLKVKKRNGDSISEKRKAEKKNFNKYAGKKLKGRTHFIRVGRQLQTNNVLF